MRQPNKKSAAVWIVMVLSVCVMAFSGYMLWETRQMYVEGDRNYEALAQAVVQRPARQGNASPLPGETPGGAPAWRGEEPQVDIPVMAIDFAALRAVNEDAVAWLYCPDTAIDYPVMRATDYDWYLHHLPDGMPNANGTLFLDYNNPPDFSGRLNIVYGHNMQSGKMFGSLPKYKKQVYFDEHPFLYLYTAETGNYRIDLLYGFVAGAGEWRDRAFAHENNLFSLLSFAAHNTTFDSSATYTEKDRFIVLSTCSYEFDDARYVVVGVLRPEYGGQ